MLSGENLIDNNIKLLDAQTLYSKRNNQIQEIFAQKPFLQIIYSISYGTVFDE